jgi:hypothetical protein
MSDATRIDVGKLAATRRWPLALLGIVLALALMAAGCGGELAMVDGVDEADFCDRALALAEAEEADFFGELAPLAPAEVREDFERMATWMAELDALEAAPMEEMGDAWEATMELVFDPEFQATAERVGRYLTEECGGDLEGMFDGWDDGWDEGWDEGWDDAPIADDPAGAADATDVGPGSVTVEAAVGAERLELGQFVVTNLEVEADFADDFLARLLLTNEGPDWPGGAIEVEFYAGSSYLGSASSQVSPLATGASHDLAVMGWDDYDASVDRVEITLSWQ